MDWLRKSVVPKEKSPGEKEGGNYFVYSLSSHSDTVALDWAALEARDTSKTPIFPHSLTVPIVVLGVE